MADDGFTAQDLIQACNKIIAYAGLVARVASVEEVRVVCSSTCVFVAALEGFLQLRLDDVFRTPSTAAERAYNCNIVVDVLSQILKCDLSHISGQRVVEGSIEDISNVLELLSFLCQGKPLLGPPAAPGDGLAAEADADPDAELEDGGEADDEPPRPRDYRREHQGQDCYEGSSEEPSPGEPQRWAWPAQQEQGAAEEQLDLAAASTSAAADAAYRRRQAGQQWDEASYLQQHVGGQLPLSPIHEVSREGWDSALAAEMHPGSGAPSASAGLPEGGGGLRHCSGGGASSLISIPSEVGGAERHSTDPGAAAQHSHYEQQQQQQQEWLLRQQQHMHSAATQMAWPGQAGANNAHDMHGGQPAERNRSATSLLERALSHADATLRGMGIASHTEGLYYADEGAEEHARKRQGRQAARQRTAAAHGAGGNVSRKASGRNPRMESRPLAQQAVSVRRSSKTAAGNAGAGSSNGFRPLQRESGSQCRAVAGLPGPTAAPGGGGKGGKRRGGSREDGNARLRSLQGPQPPLALPGAANTQGHKLIKKVAEVYRAALPAAVPVKALRSLDLNSRGEARVGGVPEPSVPAQPRSSNTAPGMHISADLEGKLRYVYGLAAEDPKQLAARTAVQRVAVWDEHMRHVRRREMLERLSNARARREAALRFTAGRLHEQGQEHERRVEQLRLQRLASEWASRQRSAQMRRALQAELALREAFLEVLAREKEVLLAERRDAKAAEGFPKYKGAMRAAEQQYMQLYHMMEELLASERQQRVRASREAEQAQRQGNQLAATVVHDRMQELLGRIARDEEAFLQRGSIATRPASKKALVEQIRRLLGMS